MKLKKTVSNKSMFLTVKEENEQTRKTPESRFNLTLIRVLLAAFIHV